MQIKLIQKRLIFKLLLALFTVCGLFLSIQSVTFARIEEPAPVTYTRENYGVITGSDGTMWQIDLAASSNIWTAKFVNTVTDPDGFNDYIQAKDTSGDTNTKDILYRYTVVPSTTDGSSTTEKATNLTNASGNFAEIYYYQDPDNIIRWAVDLTENNSKLAKIPAVTFKKDAGTGIFIEQTGSDCKDTITLNNGSTSDAVYSAADLKKDEPQAFGITYNKQWIIRTVDTTTKSGSKCYRGDKEGDNGSGTLAAIKITLVKNLSDSTRVVVDPNGTALTNTPTTAAAGADECAKQLRPFGWVLCPVLGFASNLYQTFVQTVNSILFFSTEKYAASDLKLSWAIFVRLANATIVLLGLVMLVGQIFKFEIFSAYTVKKVLPRLFIGAILIQLSWLIFTVFAQIVNALGSGIYWLLLAPFGFTSDGGLVTFFQAIANGQGGQDAVNLLENLVGGVIGTAAVAGAVAAAYLSGAWLSMIVAGVGVFIGILIALVTIMLREAVLIVLLATAPLAIAAWILPATGNIWNAWWKTYSRLLLMYPLIMMLFAGGTIAAHVLAQADSVSNTAIASLPILKNFGIASGQGSNSFMILILQIIVFFAPMFLIGMTFKFAGSLFGNVVNMTGKLGGSLNKGAGAGMKPFSERWQGNKKVREEARRNESFRRLHGGDASALDKWRTGTLGVPIRNSTRAAYETRDKKAQLQGLLSLHDDENLENKYLDAHAAELRSQWANDQKLVGDKSPQFLVSQAISKDRAAARAAQQEIIKRQDVGSWAQVAGFREHAADLERISTEASAGIAPSVADQQILNKYGSIPGAMDNAVGYSTDQGLADEFGKQRSSGEFAQAFLTRRGDWVKGDAAFKTWGPEGFAMGDKSAYGSMGDYLSRLQTNARTAGAGSTEDLEYRSVVSRLGNQLKGTIENPAMRAAAMKNPDGMLAARNALETYFRDVSDADGIAAIGKIAADSGSLK